jgi:sulfite reductase alpha subunit-like flavoprotein
MTKAKRVVFILTPQEGDEEAVALVRELDETTEDVTVVMYAICAFQNKKTKYQSHIASQLDSALEQRLASRIVRTIEIDTSTEDQGEAAFHRWALAFCTTLGLPVPELAIAVVFKLTASRDNSIIDSPLRPRGFEMARLKGKAELCPPNCGYGLTRFSAKLPLGLGFRTGSRALVLPRNPGVVVSAVAKALSIDLDQPFKLQASQNSPDLYIPDQVTPRHLFEQYVDLSANPPRSLVKTFAGIVDLQAQSELQSILDGDFAEFAKKRTVLDFIQKYAPHGIPRLDSILTASPFMIPRRFPVASSPKKGRGYLEFVIEGSERSLCYQFLNSLGKGRLAIRIEDGKLEHPKDKATPMIVIAVGIGIGPIFGLLEFRKYAEGPWGPMVVICEFKKKKHVTVIQEMLENYVHDKLISAVMWAFSEENETQYRSWKEVVLKNVSILWPVWMDDRSRVYLVGEVGDVLTPLKKLFVQMTMNEGGLRDEEAMAWTDRHVIIAEDLQEGKSSGN